MSNFWTGFSNTKLHNAEMEIVKLSGLEEDEFKSYPVKFTFTEADWQDPDEIELEDEKEQNTAQNVSGWSCAGSKPDEKPEIIDNEYIWTYELGDDSKPDLVVIHGYGGSGMLFYKMFKSLKEHFHVYLIDLLGMGRSARNEFKCETYDECERYFVNSIEKWRQAIGIDKINLLAHSMGAFIASKYALHHPAHVKKVAFFSPWACEATSQDHVEEMHRRFNRMPWFRRQIFKVVKKVYTKKGTPFGIARKFGSVLGGFFVKKAVTKRLDTIPKDEQPKFAEYMHHIIMNKGCSEYAFNIMFPDFMVTPNAIANYIDEYHEKGIEISFYFGTHDWMNSKYNGDFLSKQLRDAGETVYIIENAGHHLYFDNPEESLECILDDFLLD